MEEGDKVVCPECQCGVAEYGRQALDQTDGIRPELAIVKNSRPKVQVTEWKQSYWPRGNVADERQKWYWHLNGRMLQTISDGWPIPRTHRRVIHFCDTITAASEEEARKAQFECLSGECDRREPVEFPCEEPRQNRKSGSAGNSVCIWQDARLCATHQAVASSMTDLC